MDSSVKTIIILIFVALIFLLLNIMEPILLPLILAFFAAAFFQPLIIFLKKHKIPTWIIIPFILLVSLVFLFAVFLIIQSTFSDIVNESDYLSKQITLRINELFKWINSTFGSRLSFTKIYKQLIAQADTLWISQRASDFLSAITGFTSSLIMFLLYYVVLLAGMANYKNFFAYVENYSPDTKITASYEKIQKTINRYIGLKTLINLFTGLVVYVVCLIFGVKFALFWGFITFIVSYIPNIGAILATIFPTLMAFININSIETILLMAGILTVVHFIVGSIIEPIIMGSNMSINTLTVIFGLVFWGFIWGIPGMMLSVPLLVVIKLTFEQFPSLSLFARIMGVPEKSVV
jgi:predicted PurR-regulated permease PerM